jgi:hypothetical protein
VADVPDTLVLKRHRDLEGMSRSAIWARRAILLLITLVLCVALADWFGQRPSTQTGSTAAASLDVYGPTHLRGGDLFSTRFHIHAHRELKNATLVLDPGWAEGMAINTIEPSPIGEGSRNGRLVFQLGHVSKGQSYILFMQFQVNPTNVAWHRPMNVELDDGPTRILTLERKLTVFP